MKIILDDIIKRFDGIPALDRINLEIRDGEIFFLLGPSGCGKTTLLRIIAGFCVPDSGKVFFDGQPVNDIPAHRRNTSMVFQNYALWPHMTVTQNVAFGLTVPGRKIGNPERGLRINAMLDAMHLTDAAERSPSRISGGQQQRVALARAMIVNPDCLLLDEPLSNLDAKLRQEMRLEIRRLIRQSGATAVYVTHDQQEALSMADRCALMRNGRIVQVGTPSQLYEHPQSRFAADFIGGANLLDGRIRRVAGDGGMLSVAVGADEWLGRVAAPGFSGRPGQEVTVCARPERIRRALPGGQDRNVFQAVVEETLYYGHMTEYRLKMPAGPSLRAAIAAHDRAGSTLSVGATAGFVIDPEDVLLVSSG